MCFEKACVDLCSKEQGSSLSVLQSDTTFFLSDCCRSQLLTVVSFPVHLPGGVLHDSHAEQTHRQSAARLHKAGQLNPTNGVIPSSNLMKVFCEYDLPFKTHSVHLQRRSNRKEYYSTLCLSCTISTGGGWGYYHACFSVAYKQPKLGWVIFIYSSYVQYPCACTLTQVDSSLKMSFHVNERQLHS